MLQFLEGNHVSKSIMWLDKNETKKMLGRNDITANPLYIEAYHAFRENKYMYIGIFIVIRNIFGSNRYKIIPTEKWVNALYGISSPILNSLRTVFVGSLAKFAHIVRKLYG